MSKVVSSKEESGLNTNDNVSQGDNEETLPKRRQRNKKDKPMEEKDEIEEKPNKFKDNRKKQQQKKTELSVATGVSRSESETIRREGDLE